MKKLLITLMLISPFSFADWGDVYYCKMTSMSTTTVEGKRTDYRLENFTFKLDQTKNAMVFGKDGYFSELEVGLKKGWVFPALEKWKAEDPYKRFFFSEGKVLFSALYVPELTSMSANCDKF